MTRTRVLAVTSEPPWPLDSGGHVRTFHLLRSLAARADVRVVCPVQPQHEHTVAPLRAAGLDLRPVTVGTRTWLAEAGRVCQAALRGEPYAMYGRHAWKPVLSAWRQELTRTKPDVLYLDHLDSFMYVARESDVSRPVVLDLHNVYSLLARRTADHQPGGWARTWLRHQAGRLSRIERHAARRCETVFAVSDAEAEYFRRLGAVNVRTIANGVDCAPLADLPTGRTGPPVVLFLGTLSWQPNISAVRFLSAVAFPEVRARFPTARLLIVGRDPAPEVLKLQGPGIEIVGPVPDVKPFLAQASVLAVPIDAGGGTRLKILEAFAAGLPVVSTRIGAEGLAAEAGIHFVEAERPEFAAALSDLLACPAKVTQLAHAARRLATETYDWRRIGADATDAIAELSNRGTQPLPRPVLTDGVVLRY